MEWENKYLSLLNWNKEIKNLDEKKLVAKKIADNIKDGDVIGFGSGSTSFLTVLAIAEKIKEKKYKIMAIPTSLEITMVCDALKIPTTTINAAIPDWSFDGADEVDGNNWLIKGRGGAMFKEKLIMLTSKKNYIIVDNSKLVTKLGEKFLIPVECTSTSLTYVKKCLFDLGALEVNLRLAISKDGPVITENSNCIYDVKFSEINETLEKQIKEITGVIESGLFINYNITLIKA